MIAGRRGQIEQESVVSLPYADGDQAYAAILQALTCRGGRRRVGSLAIRQQDDDSRQRGHARALSGQVGKRGLSQGQGIGNVGGAQRYLVAQRGAQRSGVLREGRGQFGQVVEEDDAGARDGEVHRIDVGLCRGDGRREGIVFDHALRFIDQEQNVGRPSNGRANDVRRGRVAERDGCFACAPEYARFCLSAEIADRNLVSGLHVGGQTAAG